MENGQIKRFVLVEVAGRDISCAAYGSFEEARRAMEEAYVSTVARGAESSGISERDAWANDGPNHDDYDWKIVEC